MSVSPCENSKSKTPCTFGTLMASVVCFCLLFNCSVPDQTPLGQTHHGNYRQSIDSLLDLSLALLAAKDFKATQRVLDSTAHLALLIQDTLSQSGVYNNRGLLHYRQGQYDQSLLFYQKALQLDRQMQDSARVERRLKNIGISYKQMGRYQKALETYQEALSVARSLALEGEIASINNSIGNLYNSLKDFEKAKFHFGEALTVWQKSGDNRRVSIAFNNLGNAKLGLDLVQEAIADYLKALELKRQYGSPVSQSITLNNLGEAYLKLGEYDQAEAFFMEALTIKTENSDVKGVALVSSNLAGLELNRSRSPKAKVWLNKAQATLQNTEASDIYLIYHKHLIEFYKQQGQLKEALETWVIYDSLKQIGFKEQVVKVNELQYRFDLEEEEKNRLKAENELATATQMEEKASAKARFRLILALGITSITILLFVFLVRLRNKNRYIEHLMRELHHRVQNHLGMISGFFQKEPGADVAEGVIDARTRVEAINSVHRRLYRQNKFEEVDMADYLSEIITYNILVAGLYGKVEQEVKIDAGIMNIDKAVSVGLIVNEVLTNACKYGLREVEQPQLEVALSHISGNYQLKVFNSTESSQKETFKRKGFGTELIQRLSKKLKGKVTINQTKGYYFELNFP